MVHWRKLWLNDPVLNKIYGEETEPIVSDKESLESDYDKIDSINLKRFAPLTNVIPFPPYRPHAEPPDDFDFNEEHSLVNPKNKNIFDGPPWKGGADF